MVIDNYLKCWKKIKGICYLCGCDNNRWLKYIDENGYWNHEYICNKCYMKIYHRLPNSDHNIIKSMAKSRNRQLDRDSNQGKGFIGEQIFCKVRGAVNCNIVLDKFNSKIDAIDKDYGIVQVKTRSLKRGEWGVHFNRYRYFDVLVAICIDSDFQHVERVYIIPKEYIVHQSSFVITKSPSKVIRSYERFRADENIYDDAYHNLKIENCKVIKG